MHARVARREAHSRGTGRRLRSHTAQPAQERERRARVGVAWEGQRPHTRCSVEEEKKRAACAKAQTHIIQAFVVTPHVCGIRGAKLGNSMTPERSPFINWDRLNELSRRSRMSRRSWVGLRRRILQYTTTNHDARPSVREPLAIAIDSRHLYWLGLHHKAVTRRRLAHIVSPSDGCIPDCARTAIRVPQAHKVPVDLLAHRAVHSDADIGDWVEEDSIGVKVVLGLEVARMHGARPASTVIEGGRFRVHKPDEPRRPVHEAVVEAAGTPQVCLAHRVELSAIVEWIRLFERTVALRDRVQ